jgi:hypothetical protein
MLRYGALGHACEGWDCLPQEPLEKVNASLPRHTALALTRITPLPGDASPATVGTVTVEEDLQGNAQKALMGLIKKGTGAIPARLGITEHRCHTGGVLIDSPSEGVGIAHEE